MHSLRIPTRLNDHFRKLLVLPAAPSSMRMSRATLTLPHSRMLMLRTSAIPCALAAVAIAVSSSAAVAQRDGVAAPVAITRASMIDVNTGDAAHRSVANHPWRILAMGSASATRPPAGAKIVVSNLRPTDEERESSLIVEPLPAPEHQASSTSGPRPRFADPPLVVHTTRSLRGADLRTAPVW